MLWMSEKAVEYRLSWEMAIRGQWTREEIVFKDSETKDHFDQHATLKKWAETGEEPIRNVKLEWRPIEFGEWEEVDAQKDDSLRRFQRRDN